MTKTLPACLLLLVLHQTANADVLCQAHERVSFSCSVGTKSLSVCSANDKALIYRFGKPSNIELELESQIHFSRTAYSGGGEGNLTFSRGQYKYVVYSSISNGEWLEDGTRDKVERAGVYVVQNDRLLADVACTHFSGDHIIRYLPPYKEEPFQYYD